jgi:hypothetical protein|tara:strand:+ start:1313 stop:1564 length:252 start_codon:yes stop_codon:yes gene_type:complete
MLNNEHAINVLLKEKDAWEKLAAIAVKGKNFPNKKHVETMLKNNDILRNEIRSRLSSMVFYIGEIQKCIETAYEEEKKKEEVK